MTDSLFRYVALGDSTAVGIGAGQDGGYPERLYRRLKAEGAPAGILNLGQSGATSQNVADFEAPKVPAKRPHLVTVGIGTNDLWRMVPVEVFAQNLQRIANALEPANCSVVVCTVPDLALAPVARMAEQWIGVSARVLSERADQMNAHIHALAQRPRFQVLDLCMFSREELSRHPEYFSQDGFHPSAAGYDRWAQLLWPLVQPHVTASS
jgi:acyl-CoA thioesterase-1